MRVAVSADDMGGLEGVVSPHFGRCPYYVLIDLDGRQVKQASVVANPNYGRHAPGTVPMFIRDQGADVMLAGGMGRRAIALFQELGIQAATGASGTVRRALEQYLGGELRAAEPCLTSRGHEQNEPPSEGRYEQGSLGRLREEAQMLQDQLDEVAQRLDRLSNHQ